MKTAPVFYSPDKGFGSPSVSDTFLLTAPETAHFKVAKVRLHDIVDVVNGEGTRVSAEFVGESADKLAELRVISVAKNASPLSPKIILVQALLKNSRDETAVETVTELGISKIVPWGADRSIVRWGAKKRAEIRPTDAYGNAESAKAKRSKTKPDKSDKGRAKWQAKALSAMKQSRQSYLPEVTTPVDSKGVSELIKAHVNSGGVAFVLHECAKQSLADEICALSSGASSNASSNADSSASSGAPTHKDMLLITGPEGGISDSEIEAFCKAGAKPVLLGSTILRSSTASIVAVALIRGLTASHPRTRTTPQPGPTAPRTSTTTGITTGGTTND